MLGTAQGRKEQTDTPAEQNRGLLSSAVILLGLPCWLSGAESACSAGRPQLHPWSEGPLEKGRAAHSSAGRPQLHPWSEGPLEKGRAAHSGALAWETPWTEEPGGYSPWGRRASDTTERLAHAARFCRSVLCFFSFSPPLLTAFLSVLWICPTDF